MSNERREFTQMNEAFAEKGIDLDEYVALQRELDELEKEQGLKQEKGLSRLISSYFERKDARDKILVNKKRLLLVALLLGWCGGHRFMLKQKWLGVLFSVLVIPYAFVISAVVDTNSIALALEDRWNVPTLATGIVLAVLDFFKILK